MSKKVSIIIRTKNEERWIAQCLSSVFAQGYKNFEVIVVDNESSDKTLEKIKSFPVSKILSCIDYLPGRALNIGIAASQGDSIVCLSGHCVPVNDIWLESLLKNFEDPDVAGVYGRQQPFSFTPDLDKRDLTLIFGLDRKVQRKDSFFHNANSMIRKDLWRQIPFDETVTNIEDRVWAQKMLEKNLKIIYDPAASVYHYHGIHHKGNPERCKNVVRILEKIKSTEYAPIDMNSFNTLAIIPIRGPIIVSDNTPLMSYTIHRALESKYIKRVIVSTDDVEIAETAKKMGADVPFLRDPSFSRDYVDLSSVLQYSLEKIEEGASIPDWIVSLEITFPFRAPDLIDRLIEEVVRHGLDSVVAARLENKAIWKKMNGEIKQLEEGLTPRKFKEPLYLELRGLGAVTRPEFLREGHIFGDRVGMYEVNNPHSLLEIRTESDFRLLNPLIKNFFS